MGPLILLEINESRERGPAWSDAVRVVRSLGASPDQLPSDDDAFDVLVVVLSEHTSVEQLARECPRPVVVVDPRPDPRRAVAAIKAGAADYTAPDGAEAACLAAARQATSLGEDVAEALIEREQHVAVGRLAAGVAHEINNPAAFVVANLNELTVATRGLEALLRAALPLAFQGASAEEAEDLRQLMAAAQHPGIFEDLRAMVEESLEGMHRIRDIVHHLRGFSVGEDEPVVLDVHEVLRTAVDLLRPELRYRARLDIELGPVPPVLAPRSRIAQVFLSLLLNSMRSFQTLPRGQRGQLTIRSSTLPGGAAEVCIEDNGRTLPDALLQDLDNPFALTGPGEQGLSLRLATSRGIARRLGGALEVEALDPGTRIRVRLPAHALARAAPEPDDAEVDPLLGASILVIDNEQAIVRSLRRLLRDAREVRTATSGAVAVDILLSDAPPDLVLCDIIMPEQSGVEIYTRVIRERPELEERFLFITGGALTPRTQQFCAAHADRVIEKPFEPSELRARIRKALAAE